MNGIKFLLDTNIVIGLLKGQAVFAEKPITINNCAVSQITRMELLSFPKLTFEEDSAIRALLDSIIVIELNAKIENTTINFRRLQNSKLPDAIIIATAIIYKLELISLDKKMLSAYQTYNEQALLN